MSARASAYAKSLVVCPNGERLSRGEKLVLISLADSHQDKAKHFTYPSVETIAEDALCDRRTCQRHLAALERKGVIRRMRPANQGSGMMVFYFFAELDVVPEGWQNAALFQGSLFVVKGGRRAAEGRQKGGISSTASITNTNQNEELKAIPPNPPQAGGQGDETKTLPASKPDSGGIEAALDRVMDECGFTAKRLRRKLRGVVLARVRMGEVAGEVADRMIAAWNYQEKSCDLLSKKEPASSFFEEGYWLNWRRLHWNPIAVREEQLRAEARVGS